MKIDQSGNATDIRSFEVTKTTLSEAVKAPPGSETAVVEAFRRVLRGDPLLVESFSTESQRVPSGGLPNCFVYLAATLFVDSMIDGEDHGGGDFRERLAKWLGVTHSFPQLKGIASMWEFVRTWVDRQISLGKPFRKIILPDPGTWSHIGYTRRISFPNRFDARVLNGFLKEYPAVRDKPLSAINLFEKYTLNKQISWGLSHAFKDFQDAYFRGRRAIADHRFWRLLCTSSHDGSVARRKVVELDMIFEEDEGRIYVCPDEGMKDGRAYQTLTEALDAEDGARSANLGAGVAKGVLFFRPSGFGRWTLEAETRESSIGIHVAIGSIHRGKIADRLGELIAERKWLVTSKALPTQKVVSILEAARVLTSSVHQLFRTTASDGIRVGGAWLGRPRFLPKLDADTRRFTVTTSSEEVVPSVSPDGQLTTERDLNGSFIIRPALESSDSQPQWSLRLVFTSRATPHAAVEGPRSKLTALRDWRTEEKALCLTHGDPPPIWEDGLIECEDLLEALYADGAGGWEEAALIRLLDRASDTVDAWSQLRILYDAGLIEPRLRAGWRGRSWTMSAPRLLVFPSATGTLILIEGALCESLVERFRAAVESDGGTCFRRLGAGPWSPPTFGALNVSAEIVSQRLNWPIATRVSCGLNEPYSFEMTERLGLAYESADFWDWRAKRFLSRPTDRGSVTLSRLIHVGRRDHDLFKVTSENSTALYLSRTAAIAAAHAAARVPLFCQHGDVLVRLANEGGLPDALVTDMRRRRMRTAGIAEGVYCYPVTREDIQILRRMLPHCMENSETAGLPRAQKPIGSSRRFDGRIKPLWRNGKIVYE
ncbi:hypothetical protein [Caballeronia sp. 15711]|uniref:hypothetical protein n=1 Tax=Caballeronia sp. 15711 TaxID=3391029 RepID=UPI0039E47C6E